MFDTRHAVSLRGVSGSRIKRILIVGINFEPERTGIAPYTTALAEHLSHRFDVTVVTGVPHYPDWSVATEFRRWKTVERRGRLTITRLRHFVPSKPSVLGRAAYELSFAARAVALGIGADADAVIAVVPPLFGAHAARLIAHRHGIPYGVIAQDIMGASAAQCGLRGATSISSLSTALERSALRGASSIATIHPRLADELARISNISTTPSVIYNWTHVGAATRTREDARTHFGWPRDRVIALHSGNMGSKQNLEIVVDAARIAAQNRPAVQFVLAGGGNQRPSLERYATTCPNITFLPGVDDVDYTDLLRSADVLLINERPGMREMSLPSKLTSYLYAGRPIVAATDRESATGEFVLASGGGVLTPAGDPQGLLNAVVQVAGDRPTTDRLSARGQSFARQHLTRERALSEYDTWVDELVGSTVTAPTAARRPDAQQTIGRHRQSRPAGRYAPPSQATSAG